MEETEQIEKPQKVNYFQAKYIKPALLVIAVIFAFYQYQSFSKERLKEQAKVVAVDTAKSVGKYAVEQGKEKWRAKKEQWIEKYKKSKKE